MNLDRRENIASKINILIFLCELIGLILMIINYKYPDMKYFSSWVALIGIVASVCYFINYYVKNNKLLKYITLVLKYISAGSSFLILIISLFILVPVNNFDFYNIIINNGNVLLVLIAPIITLISFIYFESYGDYRLTSGLYNMYYVMVYTIIITISVGFSNLNPPYFLFDYTRYQIYVILMFDVLFVLLSYISAAACIKLNYLCHKNYHIEGEILSDKDDIEETDIKGNKTILSDEEKALMKEKLKQEILEELKQQNNNEEK